MIPDYQSIMLPLLRKLSDKQEHKFRDLIDSLANEFNLTDDELKDLLPSGQQPIFDNRVGWARTYLKKAGLIDSPKRAVSLITQRGLEILKQNPKEINVSFLKQFPEFIEFQNLKREGSEDSENIDIVTQTPEENLETAYQRLRKITCTRTNKPCDKSSTIIF